MVIDLTKLVIGNTDSIFVDGEFSISSDYFVDTSVKGLDHVYFKGNVIRLSDSDYQITGVITGNMILSDDITLEDVIYPFHVEVEEDFNDVMNDNYLQIVQNKLDITDFLWQNILVEVPSKIKKSGNEDLKLEGDGWRLITEDELESSNNSPFSELSKMFDSGKE